MARAICPCFQGNYSIRWGIALFLAPVSRNTGAQNLNSAIAIAYPTTEYRLHSPADCANILPCGVSSLQEGAFWIRTSSFVQEKDDLYG